MTSDDVLRLVFEKLEPPDLVGCMMVCKEWKRVAEEDFLWKPFCAIEWPSTCQSPNPPTESYYKLFSSFYGPETYKTLFPPKISFEDLEFFIDVWVDEELLYSKVIKGPMLRKGSWIPPPGTSQAVRDHIEGSRYKMALPVDPRFVVPYTRPFYVSVLVSRKDSNKIARIIDKSRFKYFEEVAHRVMAYDYPIFSSKYLFVPKVRAWLSMFYSEHLHQETMEVYSIMLDFRDAATSEEEVLWLLDMLEWK